MSVVDMNIHNHADVKYFRSASFEHLFLTLNWNQTENEKKGSFRLEKKSRTEHLLFFQFWN